MNKKGNVYLMVIFFVMLFALLLIGIIMVFISATANLFSDYITPELTSLGILETGYNDANVSQYAGYIATPVDSMVQSMTWVTGVLYVFGLLGILIVAFVARQSSSRWLVGLFFALSIFLILLTIMLSNFYYDFYNGGDEIGIRLREHSILSWFILYSPAIFPVVIFIGGAIMFSRIDQGVGV